ncbi:MAG: hypothetical protein FJX72_04805 [Armatimonadetes bacterium]|nr:hypothetical protein [Armatimonadota bacterium]
MKHAYNARAVTGSRALLICLAALAALGTSGARAPQATPAKRYYAHEIVEDANGVIAPWYRGMNGQVDWRVRVAAETLKRYPWTDKPSPAPHYVFNGTWAISATGEISIPKLSDWDNGDLGQRAAYVLGGLVDYYRYTGDAAAISHIWLTVEALRKHALTGPDHRWPGFLISVPTKGTPYGQANPKGMIQLDITAEVGIGLVRAYQLVGKREWWEMAKRWADLFARHRGKDPAVSPWPRYANPEDVVWEDTQTGGVAFILEFLDEVIRLGYTGRNGEIVAARDAGRRYLRDVLLPRWTEDDAWGRNYWDWNDPVQAENVTEFVARAMMAHPGVFPNWRTDVRNILTLFLNRTSVDAGSGGGVFSGAWAYPESSGCCGRSLWYGPMELAPVYAELGHRTGDARMIEMARRMMILATYDGHETGVVEDSIDGGQIVAGGWFKIAHPMALKHTLNAIAWQPETFGPARENHIVRTTHVVTNVTYGAGRIAYTTFPAPGPTLDVLRLAFRPTSVTADGKPLAVSSKHVALERLAAGDWLVRIRRDGTRSVTIAGRDPQVSAPATGGAHRFTGAQVRVVGDVGPDGGLAEVWLDGEKQRVMVDCWSPIARRDQTLYYRNGLPNAAHTIEIKPTGRGNPVARGNRVRVGAVLSSAASDASDRSDRSDRSDSSDRSDRRLKPEAQRVIFGRPERADYKASGGSMWRPATEWTVRLGHMADAVATAWRTRPTRSTVANTRDPELYRYGAHAPEIAAHFTVAPGTYTVRVHLMEARQVTPERRALDIEICGMSVAKGVDIAASAGGMYRAVAFAFPGIRARNGLVSVRLTGSHGAEAIIQALEVIPGRGKPGTRVVSVATPPTTIGNLLVNGGFEATVAGSVGRLGERIPAAGWTYLYASTTQSYIWAETDYVQHPHLGLPVIRSGKQALRTHTDGMGRTMVYQDVSVQPDTDYVAEAWVHAVDLHGRGFGKNPGDRAGLVIQQLSHAGGIVAEHAGAYLTDAGTYRKVEVRFRTGASAAKVRFILDAVQAAGYSESHVTYDDCTLQLATPGRAGALSRD